MRMPYAKVLALISAASGSGLLAASCATPEAPGAGRSGLLVLHARSRAKPEDGGGTVTRTLTWDPRRTAIVIVDMWDDHWCRGAARRVAEMAGPLNRAVAEARKRGVFILHAPSTTVGFYKDSPARRRAREAPFARPPAPLSTATRWGTNWCWPDAKREPALPIDDSDMGCDCEPKCAIRDAWTHQIAAIDIDPAADAITEDGQETYNLLAQRGIENVILMGVHLNMCVLGRPFGLRQLATLGFNCVLVRDLTDTMYNSRMKPFVDHHSGTDRVVEHVERYWCPSITSVDLAGGEPHRFEDDRRGASPR